MKRKVFDLRSWPRVARQTQTVTQVPGYVIVDFTAHEVTRPLDVRTPAGPELVRILDSGYRWVRAHPAGGGAGIPGSSVTVQLGAAGQPVQFYVDLHGGEGLHISGLPWHDDLYLDVIGHPDPSHPWQVIATQIIDGEELAGAVEAGLVSPEQARQTWTHARQIEAQLRAGTYAPLHVLRAYLEDPYT
ncbi:hypothetical protein DEIPH_ctg025orf0009 [Deinococcus phoenicis]|uniref:DUF402 domain-containing protein n=1 Tax=Deinococcus phoenicis TaxID=1476583 RepID=A0A016QQZ2_9DEIO|nr:DUF402 domain-containing protein [Deinococcus phoenicis]EYB68179.1 hypothetical protein DEIPH_ctg025orf0009 [Deinococcus phoenicis]